jgi:hypothetical protein
MAARAAVPGAGVIGNFFDRRQAKACDRSDDDIFGDFQAPADESAGAILATVM